MKVKCLLCHKELTYSNNTSSMIRHYRAIHENAQSAGSGPDTSQSFSKTTVDEALVNMVVKDSQPFSIVEDVGFKELIHALDPTYILPTRQKQMGRPVLKMIIEVDTRWNSTFSMLQRLYEVREPVGAALASLRTDITPPKSLEYATIKEAIQVLAPFQQATVELSGEK
ncbi:hypothetical protein N1851_019466 [Merluccius polli]|uniref:BED-type domain-containing protein n=1 Tax=Merluccius polli TaxID=89951 RepID=A0AA47MLK6_MERPO|nr:hypothetical protein N1851_019466 [Merluccius polli]